jgi:phosphate transport system permease protein
MKTDNLVFRKLKNSLFGIGTVSVTILAIVPLFLILFFIASKGIQAINIGFFFSSAKPTGESGGGIASALVGTSLLLLVASAVAIPIGVLTGIYLAEKSKGKLAGIVRWAVDIMQGVPSIVLGLIGYAWFVLPMARLTGSQITFSILAGGLTLSFMMTPVIVKATEETVRLIPFSLKESAIALGVPYYRTILKVVLPASINGIMTGILLGIARISGETAPLLFTVFGNYYFSADLLKPADALPLLIFNYATSPYKDLQEIAWGASLVLVSFVLVLNIVARMAVKRWKIQF